LFIETSLRNTYIDYLNNFLMGDRIFMIARMS